MLPDVSSDHISVLGIGMGQDVLNEVIAILVAGNVDQRNAWTVETTLADSVKVTAKKLGTSDLEALLDHLGSELIHGVLCSVTNDMVDGTAAVGRGTVFADMLDAPVAKLAVSHDVDVGKDFFNAWALQHRSAYILEDYSRTRFAHLVLFQAVLEDVLNNQTASLSQRDLMPHAAQ